MNKRVANFRQNGATLVVALLILLVLTVLGLASMQMTRLEERMAGNSRDVNLAFQGAEAGLRDAEQSLKVVTGGKPLPCSSAPCTYWSKDVLPPDLRDQTSAWWTANAREYGVAGTQEITEVTRDPLIVVEELAKVPDSLGRGDTAAEPPARIFYKITADSTGASNTAEVILESTYTRYF